MYDDFDASFDKDAPDRSSKSGNATKGKKVVKTQERKVDTYSVDSWRGGFVIRWESKTGNVLFSDHEKVWLRSKKPMTPMTENKCRAMIAEFQAYDKDLSFFFRGR